jgi:hypothetical protein
MALVETFARYGGLVGILMAVIILSMGTAIAFLWRHNNHLHEQLLQTQNKRVDESKEVRAELMKLADDFNKAVVGMSAAVTALKDALLVSRRGGGA